MWRTWEIGRMVKGRIGYLSFQWFGGRERSLYGLLFLYMINLKGINCKIKHHVQYLDVPSAIRPIPHGPDLPDPDGNIEYSSDSVHRHDCGSQGWCIQARRGRPVELNGLTWDMILSKESAQLLGSSKEKCVGTRNNVILASKQWERIKSFFTFQDKSSLVYCNNIASLIKSIGYRIDFLWIHPSEVSKKFFDIMGIVFHPSLLGIQYKWKKVTTNLLFVFN